MKVRWTVAAKQDRADIVAYIAEGNPAAAIRMDLLISGAVTKLADFPLSGRTGEIPGTRELIPHENYRLVYEINGQTVWVLALVHTARQWPPARSLY
ncbi:type II toxin-antitoxin system RelE/ParE family toxin [Thermithiobacillus plumbiphilus]|uniref:Type II toxin-antitoxin system RelE/ParE family toxin n=1 Tax=Thermithiobacillus plumbiphilus TaxID=1729899 RepID=A0ABU9D6N2_9PROT